MIRMMMEEIDNGGQSGEMISSTSSPEKKKGTSQSSIKREEQVDTTLPSTDDKTRSANQSPPITPKQLSTTPSSHPNPTPTKSRAIPPKQTTPLRYSPKKLVKDPQTPSKHLPTTRPTSPIKHAITYDLGSSRPSSRMGTPVKTPTTSRAGSPSKRDGVENAVLEIMDSGFVFKAKLGVGRIDGGFGKGDRKGKGDDEEGGDGKMRVVMREVGVVGGNRRVEKSSPRHIEVKKSTPKANMTSLTKRRSPVKTPVSGRNHGFCTPRKSGTPLRRSPATGVGTSQHSRVTSFEGNSNETSLPRASAMFSPQVKKPVQRRPLDIGDMMVGMRLERDTSTEPATPATLPSSHLPPTTQTVPQTPPPPPPANPTQNPASDAKTHPEPQHHAQTDTTTALQNPPSQTPSSPPPPPPSRLPSPTKQQRSHTPRTVGTSPALRTAIATDMNSLKQHLHHAHGPRYVNRLLSYKSTPNLQSGQTSTHGKKDGNRSTPGPGAMNTRGRAGAIHGLSTGDGGQSRRYVGMAGEGEVTRHATTERKRGLSTSKTIHVPQASARKSALRTPVERNPTSHHRVLPTRTAGEALYARLATPKQNGSGRSVHAFRSPVCRTRTTAARNEGRLGRVPSLSSMRGKRDGEVGGQSAGRRGGLGVGVDVGTACSDVQEASESKAEAEDKTEEAGDIRYARHENRNDEEEDESFTPPGSPPHSRLDLPSSPTKQTQKPKQKQAPTIPIANPNQRCKPPTTHTPLLTLTQTHTLNRTQDPGATHTPSRHTASSLDKAINQHLQDTGAGRNLSRNLSRAWGYGG